MADGPSYTAGYRAEAADFAAASGKPIAQVAADPGKMGDGQEEGADQPPGRGGRKCMRELELENEFLKSPDLTLEAGASRFLGHV